MVSLELPGESVDVLQTLAFDLRWSSLTTLLKQATQGLSCGKEDIFSALLHVIMPCPLNVLLFSNYDFFVTSRFYGDKR